MGVVWSIWFFLGFFFIYFNLTKPLNQLTTEPHSSVSAVIIIGMLGVRFPDSAVWKKQKMFLPHPRVKVSIAGSLRDREVACSASDRQGSNFESCVWRTVSSQSFHHPQEVLLTQFSLYVHKGGLSPIHFISYSAGIDFRRQKKMEKSLASMVYTKTTSALQG